MFLLLLLLLARISTVSAFPLIQNCPTIICLTLLIPLILPPLITLLIPSLSLLDDKSKYDASRSYVIRRIVLTLPAPISRKVIVLIVFFVAVVIVMISALVINK